MGLTCNATKGQITVNEQDCPTGVIINFNVSYGHDGQPLYEAGSSDISSIVKMESMTQIQISKAMFQDSDKLDTTNIELLLVPSMTIEQAVIKYDYSASSGQAYVIENVVIVGKKQS